MFMVDLEHLTKVVPPPKRFCDSILPRFRNRIFCVKNGCFSSFWGPKNGVGTFEAPKYSKSPIFYSKNAISETRKNAIAKPFGGRNNLSKMF